MLCTMVLMPTAVRSRRLVRCLGSRLLLASLLAGAIDSGAMGGPPRIAKQTESKREVNRIQSSQVASESDHRDWVTRGVPYIIVDEEKAQFAKLKTDEDRKKFIKAFWERRNPNPGSPENKFKEQYYKRVAYAKQHFHYLAAGPRDDRARIYIQYGPPDKIAFPVSKARKGAGGKGAPSGIKETWIYNEIEGIGKHVTVEFTDPSNSGEYRVVTDPEALRRPSAGRRMESSSGRSRPPALYPL